jgi:nucleotide-binding universal stress UspA family protein
VVAVAIDERLREDANTNATRIQTLLSHTDVEAAVDVRIGQPGMEIIAAAKQHGADLIVMGSHGKSGIERLLVGSVSERVIGHSHCPVLVVKA